MDEHRLYEAADPVEAEIVSNLLRAHGIETVILGVHGWGGRGDLAVNAYPRLHLQCVGDRPRATALLRESSARFRARVMGVRMLAVYNGLVESCFAGLEQEGILAV